MVETYTHCRLTYSDLDKLPAIAGIAQELVRLLDDVYLAGMFKKSLPEGLLWGYPRHGHPQEFQPFPEICRCPSWSWAKMDSAVALRPIEPPADAESFGCRLAEVVHVNVGLQDATNTFGRVHSGSLDLFGWITPLHWKLPTPAQVSFQDFSFLNLETDLVTRTRLAPVSTYGGSSSTTWTTFMERKKTSSSRPLWRMPTLVAPIYTV